MRARFRLVRVCRRRAVRAAFRMRRAGAPEHAIARALGLKRGTVARICAGLNEPGSIWSAEQSALFRSVM